MPKGVYKRKSWQDRFWEKVDKLGPVPQHAPELGPCWLWIGSYSRGYGQFWWKNEQWKAHRVAYMIEYGEVREIPLMHLCDVTQCVRPGHLQEGTSQDNMKDRDAKMRQAHGARNAAAKGTPEEVLEILRLYKTGEYSQEALAKMFDRTQNGISKILRGVSWKHLTREILQPETGKSRIHKGR